MSGGARKVVSWVESEGRVEQRRSGWRSSARKSAKKVYRAMARERRAQGPERKSCEVWLVTAVS